MLASLPVRTRSVVQFPVTGATPAWSVVTVQPLRVTRAVTVTGNVAVNTVPSPPGALLVRVTYRKPDVPSTPE